MKQLATIALVLAAIALLIAPRARAQAAAAPTRFTVTVEGKPGAPAILLIPGLTSGRQVFDAEAKLLAPSYRLYRVQINGFAGQSAGPNANGNAILPAIVEELHAYLAAGKLHPYVIGHSLGGLFGLMLAQAHPDDVRKLLIVDSLPFYGLVFAPTATVALVEPQGKAMRDKLAAQTPEERAQQAPQAAGMLCKSPEGQKLVTADSIASDPHVFAEAMYEDLTTDLRPQLAAIKTATVVLFPYDPTLQGPDPARFETLYKTAYAAMPNVTVTRVDDSRHFIQLDNPLAFDAQVQAILH